ncbi:M4 family metallopeptidase [Neolewinella lacunae]|uniref:M4 family metallopeptidase n=1 Tax=Neolewinella lacunae TaxID=1517758 RepID=A0A923PKW9_9BACT|nr:M4 family metallopeptidase [Neolewinella lacunae]MBC6996038.1 M4 family metallopeptidase [Neolewinella lacunae]MDN3635427.1 M4 family metallopeptidase [Neolewinella lacunae]
MHFRFFTLLMFLAGTLLAQSPGTPAAQRQLLARSGARWSLATGHYFSLTLPPAATAAAQDPLAATLAFVEAYGGALGLASPAELSLTRQERSLDGRHYLRFQRMRAGLPVFGQVLVARLTAEGVLLGLSGNLAPSTAFAPAAAPTATSFSYVDLARRAARQRYPYAAQWTATDHGSAWISPHPWNAAVPSQRTRVIELTEPAGHRAERLYLAESSGKVIFHHPLHCDLNRELYRLNTAASNLLWMEGDVFPGSLNAERRELLLATAETYHLFHRSFGRRGFDGNDAKMNLVAEAGLTNCPNASASGNAIRHCTGVVGDDIVAHEWTHNYLAAMNGLIYRFESGAINEAYADIFGEALDLLNDRGNDSDDHLPRGGCTDSGLRWKLGEDATALGTHLRDLWQPECRNDPSTRSSPDYACLNGETDNGGVHTNSGVVNRLFSLLTDGGTLNGENVAPLGMTKALHLFFHAANHYLTPVTDFHALSLMLEQSANDLIGTPLPALTLLDLPAPPSGEVFTAGDLSQLAAALRATGLREPSPCNFVPTLGQDPPPPCAGQEFVSLYTEDWEAEPLGWTLTETPVNPGSWTSKAWTLRTALPDGRPGRGIFAPNLAVGDCAADLENGTVELSSPTILLPPGYTSFVLAFDHYYSSEAAFDGGIVAYSRNGGAFAPVPPSAFLYNGYDGPLNAAPGNDNPLAGLPAFHGADQNSTTGTWGRSVVDLSALGLVAGDELQLRWVFGHDGCTGWLGWYVDEVSVGGCRDFSLPVTYQSLRATAAKDHIALRWTTGSEDRNAGFFVERQAENDASFTEIAFVPAGDGSYHFADYGVVPGTAYVYRLRQRDWGGAEAYSPLVSARLEAAATWRVYPNPASDWLTVEAPAGVGIARLYDAAGRLVASLPLRDGVGRLTTEALPAGLYWLRAGAYTQRVILGR